MPFGAVRYVTICYQSKQNRLVYELPHSAPTKFISNRQKGANRMEASHASHDREWKPEGHHFLCLLGCLCGLVQIGGSVFHCPHDLTVPPSGLSLLQCCDLRWEIDLEWCWNYYLFPDTNPATQTKDRWKHYMYDTHNTLSLVYTYIFINWGTGTDILIH